MGGYWVGSIKLTIPCNCKGLASRLPGILPIGVPAKQTEPPTMDLNSTAASYSNQHRAKPQGQQPHYHHITTHQNMRFVDGIPLLNVDTDMELIVQSCCFELIQIYRLHCMPYTKTYNFICFPLKMVLDK